MCGIVGILSTDSSWETKSILFRALAELVNRGYDSMGVSMMTKTKQTTKFILKKSLDKKTLFQFIKEEKRDAANCVGHTRWATHGGVTVDNAHPHVDTLLNQFSLVHNGIIENYECIKRRLVDKGVSFRSQTDSEVIVNLLAYTYLHIFHAIEDPKERIEKSLSHVLPQLEGTYALIIQDLALPEVLYCARKGSPLLIGFNEDETRCLIVSEKSGFLDCVVSFFSLTDHSLYCLTQKDDKVTSFAIQESQRPIVSIMETDPAELDYDTGFEPYSCYTEKEIFEQPNAILRCFNYGARFRDEKIFLGGLRSVEHELRKCRLMYIFGCGTSYHAALVARGFFLDSQCFDHVLAFDASEFELCELPITSGKSCALFITQSGETLDMYTILEKIGQQNDRFLTLGIVNVVDSLIAKTVDAGVYMNCFRERGVASTKSFTNSVLVCWMIAQWFMNRPMSRHMIECMLFPPLLEDFLLQSMSQTKQLVQQVSEYCSSILAIGRGKDFYIAKEGCLKIKELSYAHAEAYSSSSLKHGPFALLHPRMLVFFLATDPKWYTKASNSFYEVYARHPYLVLLCTPAFRQLLRNDLENVIYITVPDHTWSFLFANVFLQCFALQLAQHRGIDPDFPRNLAKVVTVE